MAKQLVTHLIDDIDEKPIADGSGEQISFSVNGVDYQIDLNTKNATEFHRKLDYYIEHGTRVGRRTKGGTTKATGGSTARTGVTRRDPAHTRTVREWANANGYEVSARGRIPADVEQAFDAAH